MSLARWVFVTLFALGACATPSTNEAAASIDPFSGLGWDKSHRGTTLDLTGYRETFRDDFNAPSVTGPNGRGPWYAPVHTPFGAALFKPPLSSPDPFSVSGGELRIRMEKVGGAWQSGLMQTVNGKGRGFKQIGGYFEMRAKLPPGRGSWPAFWLLSANEYIPERFTEPRIEIDVVEAYGKDDFDGHHATVHIKPGKNSFATGVTKPHYKSSYTNLSTAANAVTGELLFPKNSNMFDREFHTYGTLITPEFVIIYYDALELARFPASPYFQTPLYMLVDLALFAGEKDGATGPKDMIVDYVRAFDAP